MRHYPHLVLVLLVAVGGTGCAGSKGRRTAPIVLCDVCPFDVFSGTMGEARDILIENGHITAVGERIAAPKSARWIDCAGKCAVPGLFDCHTHFVHLTKEGNDGLKTSLASFVAKGVTQVRDVGGPIDVLSGMSRRISSGEISGPEIFYTGPMLEGSPLTFGYVNAEFPGFTVAIDTRADVDRVLPELARQGACIVKTFNKMDPDVYRHLVDVAAQHKLRVVHDPGTPLFHRIPMDAAIELGVTSIEHGKAPWPVVLREELKDEHDGLVGPDANEMQQMMFMMRVSALGADSVSQDRLRQLADQMRQKGAYLCPTLQVFAALEAAAFEQVKQQQHLDEIPEMMRRGIRQGLAAMEQASLLFVREFAARGVRLLVGQDGNDPAGTFAEMRRLKECGVSEAEIIRGATIYPAQWLGVDDRLGSLSPGREANILIVEGNPLEDIGHLASAVLVVQKGLVAFDSAYAGRASIPR